MLDFVSPTSKSYVIHSVLSTQFNKIMFLVIDEFHIPNFGLIYKEKTKNLHLSPKTRPAGWDYGGTIAKTDNPSHTQKYYISQYYSYETYLGPHYCLPPL